MKPYYFVMQKNTLKKLSNLPEPPYYAVIFTSISSQLDTDYIETADRMLQLAARQSGFLGVDSVRENTIGITVSYWADEKSIQQWKQQLEHQQAQKLGKTRWYDEYAIHIAKVERSYSFEKAVNL